MSVKMEMCSKKGTVKINGREVKIPKEQLEFFNSLKETAEETCSDKVVQRVTTVDVDDKNQSVIRFGYTTPVYKEKQENELIAEVDKVIFNCEFSFDLKTYTLRNAQGKVVTPNRVLPETPPKWVVTQSSPAWVSLFIRNWNTIIYANTRKTLLKYMFDLSASQKHSIECQEKLLKAGIRARPSQIVNKQATTLHEMLGIPSSALKILRKVHLSEGFLRLDKISRYDWEHITEFQHWKYLECLNKNSVIKTFFKIIVDSPIQFAELLTLVDGTYDPKTLMHYIKYDLLDHQNMRIESALTTFRDYLHMSQVVYGKIQDKYPKYLKSQHDIITGTYAKFKIDIDAKAFSAMQDKWKSLEDSASCPEMGNQQCQWVLPSTPEDLKEEGKIMHHCVGSYADKVTRGDTIILFWRSKSASDGYYRRFESLLTMEINPTRKLVVQVRGASNRSIKESEYEALKAYCERHELEISTSIQPVAEPKPVILVEAAGPDVPIEIAEEELADDRLLAGVL
jgi:hypothetical protein